MIIHYFIFTREIGKKSAFFKVYPYKQLYPYKGIPFKWLLLYIIYIQNNNSYYINIINLNIDIQQ